MFDPVRLSAFAGLLFAGTPAIVQQPERLANQSGVGVGTINQDQYSFVNDPTLPKGDRNPDAEERKRLIVEWDKVTVGYFHYDKDRGGRRWKDDDSLHPDRRMAIRGRLLIASRDGKTRTPINWVQGIRVVVSRLPDKGYDWSVRHELHDADFGDDTIRNNGEFMATVSLAEILRPVGKKASFQVALSLGEKKGQRITWKNTFPVLPQSVTNLKIPGPPRISETMRIINGAPSYDQRNFDPAKLVRAVNHLRPLGKEAALRELRTFLKVARDNVDVSQRIDDNIDTSDNSSVFLIVRLLFEASDSRAELPPIMRVPFTPILEETSKDRPLWPLHPVHLQDDLPFLLVFGGGLGGAPEHPISHVEWAEKHGKIRSRPLYPRGSPLVAAQRLGALPQTRRLFASDDARDGYEKLLIRQALNAIENADPATLNPKLTPPVNIDIDWESRQAAAEKLNVRWNEDKQGYDVLRR